MRGIPSPKKDAQMKQEDSSSYKKDYSKKYLTKRDFYSNGNSMFKISFSHETAVEKSRKVLILLIRGLAF